MSGPRTATIQLRPATVRHLQQESFSYFLYETSRRTGLVRDKTKRGWPASIAAVGMALTAYPIGVERRLITRKDAVRRVLTALRFLWKAPQGKGAAAAGYKGFYYHFLDMETGRRAHRSEVSTMDSALLFAGALTAAAYFQRDDAREQEIRTLADAIYRRADWRWAQGRGATVTHGWKPECGLMRYRWEGYDEALILYVLALGSPTHPVAPESYAAWLSTYRWRELYGIPQVAGAGANPLFVHQLSHLWIDFRGIRDAYMRERGIDYFENSRRATLTQQQYAIRNPRGFRDYNETCWGLTAADGPGPRTLKVDGVMRRFYDYVARGVPDGPDDGTLAPWAVVASLPFAPEIVAPTVEYYRDHLHLHLKNPYGFKATFNATYPQRTPSPYGWVSPYHYGINQGPILVMVENHRSGLVWNLMRTCPYVIDGLRRAGFRAGWL